MSASTLEALASRFAFEDNQDAKVAAEALTEEERAELWRLIRDKEAELSQRWRARAAAALGGSQ
jgi:hypothetical protein